jgi:hypothetical protein
LVGESRDILSQTIREYGLILPSQDVPGTGMSEGATRVTTSVNPKQSTGQPAGSKACGLLFLTAGFKVSRFQSFKVTPQNLETLKL